MNIQVRTNQSIFSSLPPIQDQSGLNYSILRQGHFWRRLTAGGNAVANGKVLISVNGAEAVSYDLGEDGTLSIALSDLTDATGKLNIAVNFEETDDYKGSSDTISTVLVVKTVTEKIDPVDTGRMQTAMLLQTRLSK